MIDWGSGNQKKRRQSETVMAAAKSKPSRQNSAGAQQPTPDDGESDEYKPMFLEEISDIMRGFGDCESPQLDSVILVEKIVIQQMRSILNDVIDLSLARKGHPMPSQKDFEHLMRHNPTRIHRLQKHLRDIDFRRRYNDMITGRVAMFSEEDDGRSDGEEGSIPEKYDEEKVRRLFRADRISLTLSGPQYVAYNEARRTSFHCRNSLTIRNKLKMLLNPPSDVRITLHVYTILGYLVHETIATIVDYAILTRLNSSNQSVEPYGRITPSGELIRMHLVELDYSFRILIFLLCFVLFVLHPQVIHTECFMCVQR